VNGGIANGKLTNGCMKNYQNKNSISNGKSVVNEDVKENGKLKST
jgi:hypothetical protein